MSDAMTVASELSHELALAGEWGSVELPSVRRPLLDALTSCGTELWLDTGDRAAAAGAWGPELAGLTTNNTLVNQVIQTGALDDAIAAAADRLKAGAPGLTETQLVREVGFVANARVALDLVRTFGVRVSVELHPDVAEDVDGTVWWARRYYRLCPERFIIKVPLTPDGYVAVRQLSAEGIPVNYTLGFSARQNYLAAVLSRPAYVNVFLGRLNAVIESNGYGSGANVGERACLASDAAMKRLRAEPGGPPTKQIAASIRSGDQLATLAGVDVHTIPPKALAEFLSLGFAPEEIRPLKSHWLDVDASIDLSVLWDLPDSFRNFARNAVASSDKHYDGGGLVATARHQGVRDLFHHWSPDECAEIRADGKIPKTAKWLDRVALDDLMTRAALESFRVDQEDLDNRIRGLI